jgi:RHH-type rel operon transcriptional repressor/antitoxin RelB
MKEILTLRIDSEIKEKLDQIAQATKRSKSFIASEAINEYIKLNEWQIKAIQEGIRQADEGMFVSHDQIKSRWVK